MQVAQSHCIKRTTRSSRNRRRGKPWETGSELSTAGRLSELGSSRTGCTEALLPLSSAPPTPGCWTAAPPKVATSPCTASPARGSVSLRCAASLCAACSSSTAKASAAMTASSLPNVALLGRAAALAMLLPVSRDAEAAPPGAPAAASSSSQPGDSRRCSSSGCRCSAECQACRRQLRGSEIVAS